MKVYLNYGDKKAEQRIPFDTVAKCNAYLYTKISPGVVYWIYKASDNKLWRRGVVHYA